MKVIFLDFDGVIITWKSFMARKDWDTKQMDCADKTTTDFLERLCYYGKNHPVKIVISSSWRHNKDACYAVIDKAGLIPYLHEDWSTILYGKPTKSKVKQTSAIIAAMTRGMEINEWLDRHKEISDYKILDDDTHMLAHQRHNFIECDGVDGLSGRQMRQLELWVRPAKYQVGF